MIILLISFILAKEPITCEFYSPDIGHVTGVGEDLNKARANASITCFGRRTELYKRLRGEMPGEARQLLFIDSCVNIKCKASNE